MADGKLKVPCIAVTQPIGMFYIAAMDARDLVRISFADVRRIEDRDIEVLSGIQRPLSMKRVDELKKYVRTVDAAFPTGIILAISSEDACYCPDSKEIEINDRKDVAKIIDGQHRIEGLNGFDGTFQLNVTIFVEMDMEDQALLFATINLKQTVVSKSLAYDLFEFAEKRSPQKTCHNIAKLLNAKEGSPFHRKIMILGRATGHSSESLTQAAFIDTLMPYISRDPMSDRDRIKRDLPLIPPDPGEVRVRRLIFRNLFISDRDADIALTLWNYFGAVSDRWPRAWKEPQQGIILNRTTGFRALMRFLPLAYLNLVEVDAVPTKEQFAALFKKIELKDEDFTPENFKPGTSGQAALYNKLTLDTRINEESPWRK